MKNFLELLDTDLTLDIVINGRPTSAGLHDFLTFDKTDMITVDGIEVLPKYQHLTVNNILEIREPFYQWHHRISGQGWLLVPH